MTNVPGDRAAMGSVPLGSAITTDVRSVPPEATLREAAEQMRASAIGFLPVVEGRRPIGVITDRDIALRGTGRGLDPERSLVREIMTPIVASVMPEQGIEHAVQVMRDRRVRRVVVIDDKGDLCGLLSLADLVRDERVSVDVVAGVLAAVMR